MAEEENQGFDIDVMKEAEKENAVPKHQVQESSENQDQNTQQQEQNEAETQTEAGNSGEQGEADNQGQESEQQVESQQQETDQQQQEADTSESSSESQEGEQPTEEKGLSDLFGGQTNGESEQSQQEQQPQVDPQVQQELQQYGVNDPTDPNQVVQAIRNLQQQQQQSEVPQELKDDPVFEDFKNWRSQGGKDINEFAKRYSVPNPEELDTKTAYQKQLELKGLSQESINEAVEEFEGYSNWQQELYGKQALDELRQQYQKQEEAKKQGPDPQGDIQQEQQKKIDEFSRQYESLVTNTVGNEVYGWQITQDVAEDIKQRPFKEGKVVMKGDQLDPQATAMLNLIENYGDKIFETVKTKAKNELNKQEFQETQKPAKNDTPTRSSQQTGGEKTMDQKAEEMAKEFGWS